MTFQSRQNSKAATLRDVCTLVLAGFAWLMVPVGVSAQALSPSSGFALPDIPVLTIAPDQLFASTQFGQRLAKEVEALGSKLTAENRTIEARLAAEEAELTEIRETLSPEEFRDLADKFDAKVTGARSTQDNKARALATMSEQAQRGFLQSITPVLEELMTEKGASVILDFRVVFASTNASDITKDAIARIDARLGDGAGLDDVLPRANGGTALPEQ